MDAFVPKVSWFLIKRSDQVKIIFENDEIDTNNVNIGRVCTEIDDCFASKTPGNYSKWLTKVES